MGVVTGVKFHFDIFKNKIWQDKNSFLVFEDWPCLRNLSDFQCPDDKEEVNNLITRDQMVALGRQLGDNWRKLATELGFGGEDIADFEELPDEETKLPGTKMIFLWQVWEMSCDISVLCRFMFYTHRFLEEKFFFKWYYFTVWLP